LPFYALILFIELGATPSEILKEMPGPNEIDAALKRRLAAATAARKLQQTESRTDEKPSRKKPHSSSLVQTAQVLNFSLKNFYSTILPRLPDNASADNASVDNRSVY